MRLPRVCFLVVCIALRPRRSERRAQIGAHTTHKSADQLKARLIHTSLTFSAVPIEGITDCIAVFPAAVTSMTVKSSAMRPEEIGFGCEGGGVGASDITPKR